MKGFYTAGSTNKQCMGATAKIKKILDLYSDESAAHAVCIAWLEYASRFGSAPNAEDIAQILDVSSAKVSLVLRQINRDLMRIGQHPMRAY